MALLAILPTLATGAACIFTSSVSVDGDSPIVRMMQTTYPDGSPVVRSLCWVQACMTCQRKGIADRCTHIIRMFSFHYHPICPFHHWSMGGIISYFTGPPQHFSSWGAQERVSRLMSIDTDAHKREMLNIGSTPNVSSAFQREWIDAMVSRTYTLRKTVQHIFVTIDPSAGKDRNYYALMSTIFVDGQCVVCHFLYSDIVIHEIFIPFFD